MSEEITIPILRAQDIVDLVSEWGLNISLDEINKPTAATVQAIYDQFLWEMLHVRLDDLDAPRSHIMQDMEYAELYTEGLKLRMYYHLVRTILNRTGVESFSLQDIARPDGLRLRKIISIVRNLLAFKSERKEFMDSMTRKLDDAKNREAQLLEEEKELQEQYNEMLRRRATEDAKIPEAKERNAQKKKLLDREHKKLENLKKEAELTKREAMRLRDNYNDVSGELESAKQRNMRDRARIVQSPDRLKRTIANLATTVDEQRAAIEANQTKARDYSAKLTQLSVIEQDFRQAEELLTALQSELDRLDQANRDLHEYTASYNNRMIEYRELTTKAEQLARQIQSAQEKFERVQRTSADKRQASMQKMELLRERFTKVNEERSGMLAEHDLLRKDIEDIEKEMSEYIKVNEVLLNDLLAEYWNLRHDVDNYMGTLAAKFGLDIDPSILPALTKVAAKKKKVEKKP